MEAKTEWRDEVYMKPIAWNYNKGTKQVRTVRFGGLYFEVLGKRYLCCGTIWIKYLNDYDLSEHILMTSLSIFTVQIINTLIYGKD